ncbi:hypothetical protein [Streptomyces sp. NPDC051577]|uniref:hypothetical protein n=1 Tax=Streptomyces sp. NPDC051577 TaxID=3155166 RepID=UPI00341282E9
MILAAAVTAGLTASSASAQAPFCNLEGASYKCEYGITERSLPFGEEKFVIGTDGAVWTNYSEDKGGWYSLDGFATSQVFIEGENTGNNFHTTIVVLGGDGKPWARERPYLGANWTPWVPAPRPR